MNNTELTLMEIYDKLFNYYGPQNWWPGDTDFEIMLGAILTQNTSWENVEKAILNLKPYLDPYSISKMDENILSVLIKPSGFFNVKTKRIKNFLGWYEQKGFSVNVLREMKTQDLRDELLSVNGIGRETADSIILYAVDKPIFVVDAYTKRLFERIGFEIPKDYDSIQELFHSSLETNTYLFNEYHALIVIHCKTFCKSIGRCENCFLNNCCNFYKNK
ncbi:endonuclease III domain-containing protein [Serpentinicella alkaliphila]|uniref:DNA-3-methyladenine glycosylase III n=1 Tax=Serpentinicella alkaliphila TaxID=1734049 RepID=A0A4R2TS25_9FIRM|nr:endonuclease III domain-containing protein [Serpentinicella alkaliphila]QUH24441.1 endonuclease III domain-containing protein [Serpentinicella alkaliphila]TCQ04165.1 DNA-3-methyladenine glycosylase III [Serpentinicella alkaliphila]